MVSQLVALGATAVTLAVFAALGVWYSRGDRSIEAFVTARGGVGRRRLTATLVASVMGVWILFSVPEAGAAFGGLSAVLGYAVGEALPMLAYARLGPRIRELIPEGHSLTEYAYVRYGRAFYAFVLGVSLFYMFIFLAAELTGVASALHLVAGVPRWQTVTLVGGAVLLYTTYGGLRASIATDALQTAVILPLLVVAFVGALFALGGPVDSFAAVARDQPVLLNPGFLTGLQFGVWVAIAVLGAELVNQTWWQRVYAARETEDLPRAFGVAAVVNFLVVLLAGLFGVLARGHADLVTRSGAEGYNAGVALFVLLEEAFPEPLVLAVVLLALLLVMSTADTLFNAVASLVTADLPRLLSDPDERTLRRGARALTVVVALAALYVSLRARSVLRLFLLADLLGVAVATPLLSGLYSERTSGIGALVASVAALAVGLVYFPITRGTLASIVGAGLPDASFLVAFLATAGVSVALTGADVVRSDAGFDLGRLSNEIRRLDQGPPGDGQTADD